MKPTQKVWMDGELVEWGKATVHVINHSLHYGSAVFEGIRFYDTDDGPAIFRLKDHLKRLLASAKVMGMKLEYDEEQLAEAVVKTVEANGLRSGYIRPVVYYGGQHMGFDVRECDTHVAIAVWPWEKYAASETLSVMTSSFRKPSGDCLVPEVKVSGYYALSILALMEAKKRGYDGCVVLDKDGNVVEGPIENVFLVKGNKVVTPAMGSFLPGITRESIIRIANDMRYGIEERPVSLEELKEADEAFFTGTASEVAPIGKLDDAAIGDGKMGPVTKKLKDSYEEVINGHSKKYAFWLTTVNRSEE